MEARRAEESNVLWVGGLKPGDSGQGDSGYIQTRGSLVTRELPKALSDASFIYPV